MSAAKIRENIDDKIWYKYFKFCIIRNPFDKLISAFYLFMKQKNKHVFNHQQKNKIELIRMFRIWLKNGGIVKDWNKYKIDGQVCIDYFIRYEKLEEGIKHVCKILEIPFTEEIPKYKTGFRRNDISIQEYYNSETIAIVKENYEWELNQFGYGI